MGIFGFGKKRVDTIDFTKLSNSQIPQSSDDIRAEGKTVDLCNDSQTSTSSEPSASSTDFLNTMASSSSSLSSISTSSGNVVTQVSEMAELRVHLRKLTGKIEDSDNQVYRLMQRIELLERKIERFENRGI